MRREGGSDEEREEGKREAHIKCVCNVEFSDQTVVAMDTQHTCCNSVKNCKDSSNTQYSLPVRKVNTRTYTVQHTVNQWRPARV